MAYAQAHRTPLPAEGSASRTGPSFVVDQAMLNSKFEAYKLIQDDDPLSIAVKSYGLPSRPPRLADLYQSRKEGKREGKLTFTGLGYKETKERALHQLLVPSRGTRRQDEPFAAYIDANGFIVALTYDAGNDKVLGHPVHRLSQRPASDNGDCGEPLPSLASVSSTQWIASDVNGELVLLRLGKNQLGENGMVRWTAGSACRWTVASNGAAIPGSIKACKKLGSKVRVLVQSIQTDTKRAANSKQSVQGLGFQKGGQQPTKTTAERQTRSQTAFEVRLLEITDDDVSETNNVEGERNRPAALLWTVHSDEPLMQAQLGEHDSLLCAETPFVAPRSQSQESSSTAHESVHAGPSSNSLEAAKSVQRRSGRRRAPHFSWAQTGDTVTVAFALPSWINKSHIRAHFSPSALSLSLTHEALTLLTTPSSAKIAEVNEITNSDDDGQDDDDKTNAARMIASGRYVSRSTWAEIDPTGSVWTVEKARGMSLLTLHLEKKHEGTRWMQVFADRTDTRSRGGSQRKLSEFGQSEKSTTRVSFQQAKSTFERVVAGYGSQEEEMVEEDAEDNEDDVPETMDPSELISMLEGMQKYTVDEESTEFGMDRTGLHHTGSTGQNGGTSLSLDQPSLLKDSLEEEDANVGRNLVISTVSHSSGVGMQIHSSREGETIVLATSLPSHSQDVEALAIKHDLDGAIFQPSTTTGGWQHVATMPALAFVLASKRDAQRVHIHRRQSKNEQHGGYVALAFESAPQVTGSGSNGNIDKASGAGNLFLYYSPSSAHAKHAQSRVVRLGAGGLDSSSGCKGSEDAADASGALLGVCSVLLPTEDPLPEVSDAKPSGEEALACLCENRILLLRGVL